jgi:hypothetical protein
MKIQIYEKNKNKNVSEVVDKKNMNEYLHRVSLQKRKIAKDKKITSSLQSHYHLSSSLSLYKHGRKNNKN